MSFKRIALVSPALADANNGNWQTASRWARMLGDHRQVRLLPEWDGGDDDLLVALHARRSADSVSAWSRRRKSGPVVVVLTGTDLYGDLLKDPKALRSLAVADRLVVLNERGIDDLPADVRHKAVVCLQSATLRKTLPKSDRLFRCSAPSGGAAHDPAGPHRSIAGTGTGPGGRGLVARFPGLPMVG